MLKRKNTNKKGVRSFFFNLEKFNLFALLIIFFLSFIALGYTPVAAQSADQLDRICASDPSDSRCTGTKETCEAKGYTWIEDESTCQSYTAPVEDIGKGITKAMYKYSLATCYAYSDLRDDESFVGGLRKNISEEHALSFQWFSDTFAAEGTNVKQPLDIFAGYWLYSVGGNGVDEYGRVPCSDPAFIQAAGVALGYRVTTSSRDGIFDMMCDLGFRREGGDGCGTGTGSWFREKSGNDARNTYLKNSGKSKAVNDLTDAQKYKLLFTSVMSQCDLTLYDLDGGNLSQGVEKLWVYEIGDSGNGAMVEKYAKWGSDKKSFSVSGSGSDFYTPGIGSGVILEPRDTNNWAAGSVSAGAIISGSVRMAGELDGCASFIKATNLYAEAYSQLMAVSPASDPTAGQTSGDSAAGSNESTCNIQDIGWLLCPVLRTGANLADSAYGYLSENFLEVDSGLFTSNQTAAAWGVIRNIANVAFVIVFLIVIFSQLTGMGVSNYGVKKLLPRLIIGAILVNTSFFICQLAVDLSNIAGYGLKNMFTGISGEVLSTDTTQLADQSGHLGGILSLVIVGAAGVALIWINLGAVILAIVAGLVTLLTVFVLLIARQTFIVLLVVISPLAFIAYLLPNTEKYFQQWRKIFTGLLLLFPIIGLLYGAAQLASSILLAAAGDDVILQVAAYLALVIPLFAIWPLLKGSMNAIPAIGNAIQGLGKRGSSMAQAGTKSAYDKSRLGQYQKYQRSKADLRRAQIQGGTYKGSKNPFTWGYAAASGINRGLNKTSGKFGSQMSATGASLQGAEKEQQIKNASELIKEKGLTSSELQELALGNAVTRNGQIIMQKPSEAVRHAAIRQKLATATIAEVEALAISSGQKGPTGEHIMSQSMRQELAAGIHSNGHAGKADYFNGDFADRILKGEVSSAGHLDDAAARRIKNGKLSSEYIAKQDATALERFANVGSSGGTSSEALSRAEIDTLRDSAIDVINDPELYRQTSGEKRTHIGNISRL